MANPNSGDNDSNDPNDPNDPLEQYKPLLQTLAQKLTISTLLGYCSALTAKKVGKSMAVAIGVVFLGLQGLAHKGFIEVDWKKVEKSVKEVVDTDNDGEFTEKDLLHYWSKVKSFLMQNIPDASGFTLGFYYGLKG